MDSRSFVETYYPFARKAQKQTGVPLLFALAQSALESGWGKSAPNFMLFGMKTGSGKNFGGWEGARQLITTTEYGDNPSMKFPEILPGYPKKEGNKWKYMVKDYFRAYPSPLHTFLDWAGMLSSASRYSKAMQNKHDPFAFALEVANGGYATDPNYFQKVKKIMLELMPMVKAKQRNNHIWVAVAVILIFTGVVLAGIGISKGSNKKRNSI
jgi:flagellum-specific peptidoglycan hydrolase FlgJ